MNLLPLRPNVCLLIINREGKLFLGERAGCPGEWQLPQGGVENELGEKESALKEAYEELGAPAEHFQVIRRLKAVNSYEFSPVPPRWIGKYRGQTQTFWVLKYTGSDQEIKLDRYEPEFMQWKWCTLEEARRMAEPRRMRGYQAAFAEFEELVRTGEL